MKLIPAFQLTVIIIAAFMTGCSTPNSLSHSNDFYGSRQSKSEYRYIIKHRLERSPVYLIGGAAAGLFGLTQWPSSSMSTTGGTSSSGNTLYALAGLGIGAYAIYTWFNTKPIDQTFEEYGEAAYYSPSGTYLGTAQIQGDRIIFPSDPGVKPDVELPSGRRIQLDLKGRFIE